MGAATAGSGSPGVGRQGWLWLGRQPADREQVKFTRCRQPAGRSSAQVAPTGLDTADENSRVRQAIRSPRGRSTSQAKSGSCWQTPSRLLLAGCRHPPAWSGHAEPDCAGCGGRKPRSALTAWSLTSMSSPNGTHGLGCSWTIPSTHEHQPWGNQQGRDQVAALTPLPMSPLRARHRSGRLARAMLADGKLGLTQGLLSRWNRTAQGRGSLI